MVQKKTKKTAKKTTQKKVLKKENKMKDANEECKDRDCPVHGNLKTRGRTFKGTVISKNHRRVAIELEKMKYIRKYERYTKIKIKMHARLPDCMEDIVNVGDLIKIQECRPLSKIIHFVVIEKIKGSGEEEK
jgi:small subunit ribosomal protein S17